jgi:hypothetical protein
MWRHAMPAAAGAVFATSALAQIDLKITVPAAPGGAWDQTAHAIEQALREGAREFHFLRGQEAYKYGWGAVDRWNQRRSFRRIGARHVAA